MKLSTKIALAATTKKVFGFVAGYGLGSLGVVLARGQKNKLDKVLSFAGGSIVGSALTNPVGYQIDSMVDRLFKLDDVSADSLMQELEKETTEN